MKKAYFLPLILLASAACSRAPLTAQQVVDEVDKYAGQSVRVKALVESGAKCRLETESGKWETYCGDCQFCEGPFVVKVGEPGDGWPLVLSGTVDGEKLGCKGKLNEVQCTPFEAGKVYVLEGLLERGEPHRLIVESYELASAD